MSQDYQDFFKKAQRVKKNSSNKRHDKKRRIGRNKASELNAKDKTKPFKTTFFWVGAISVLGLFLSAGWIWLEEGFSEGFTGLEISMGPVFANQPAEKNTPAAPAMPEKSASSGPEKKPVENHPKSSRAVEDSSYFNRLVERKNELDQREKNLDRLELELQKQKEGIEKQIERLEKLRAEVSEILKERVEIDEDRVKQLVEVYSNMKPKQAAEVIETLNEKLAIEVLGRMKKQNAAQILDLMKKEKARSLTEKFAGYQGEQ